MATIAALLTRLLEQPRRRAERGQGMVEYAFILSLVVIGLIVIVAVIGRQDNNMWSNVTNGLQGH